MISKKFQILFPTERLLFRDPHLKLFYREWFPGCTDFKAAKNPQIY